MKDRCSAAAAAMIAACLWGCNDASISSEYKTYDQLPSLSDASRQTTSDDDSRADDPFADPAAPPVSALDCENSTVTTDVADAGPTAVSEITAVAATTSTDTIVPKTLQSFVPKPGGIQLLVPEPKFRAEGPKGALRVTYDDLDLFRVLNMEPVPDDAVEHFPDWLKELSGKRIRIRGYMLPTFEATGLDRFVLTRDTGLCCFGPNAKIFYLIGVELQPGKTVDYLPNRPFDVVGIFHIDMIAEGGKQMGLYWIDDAQVIWR